MDNTCLPAQKLETESRLNEFGKAGTRNKTQRIKEKAASKRKERKYKMGRDQQGNNFYSICSNFERQ